MSISWYEFLIMSGIISGASVPSVSENVIEWDFCHEQRQVERQLEMLDINFKSSDGSIIIIDPEMV